MNIVVYGAGFENKGAEAMLRTVQFEWSRRCPDSNFFLAARPPDIHQAFLHGIYPLFPTANQQVAPSSLPQRLIKALTAPFQSPPSLLETRLATIRSILKKMKLEQFDGFIDISGYQYGDAWGERGFNNVMPWVKYCDNQTIPMVFLPQSWGPFKEAKISTAMKLLKSAKPLTMPRDRQSAQYLQALDPTTPQPIFPDIAWLFEGAPGPVGAQLIAGLGIDLAAPLIAVVPNMRVYEKTGKGGSANPSLRCFAEIARHAIKSLKATILVMPNEIHMPSSQNPDDRYLCSILETMINDRQHCFVVKQRASAESLKSILGQCDAVVASRYHSLLFAISSGVPAISVGWSHKYDELLGDLGLAKYATSCEKSGESQLPALFDELWAGKDDLSRNLKKQAAIYRQHAGAAFDTAVEHMKTAQIRQRITV